jgi:hypothetical protein
MNHNLPVRFNKAIGRLPPRRAGNNRGLLEMKERADIATKKFVITVTLKLFGKSASFRSKGKKGGKDVVVM